jgi:hypothetical protein
MSTTEDASASKDPSRKWTGRYLRAGNLGVSSIPFVLAVKHVPWWAVLLCSVLALVIIAIQSVIPQESQDRVDVIRLFFAWLEARSARGAATPLARKRRGKSRIDCAKEAS